ncbi:MAG: hypothetical protein HQM06_14280 [Magnetococcales bacterium]|nr:hypothetical protein [Magnetococcales bacterium]
MEISQQLGLPVFRKNPDPVYEMNYYGAAQLVADKLGLKKLPPLSHLSWIHGWRPEKIVYPDQLARDHHMGVRGKDELQFTITAQQRRPYLVAVKEYEALLQANGYPDTRAVGLPFVYVDPNPESIRIPGSLLVMPTHVLIGMDARSDEREYLEYIRSIAHRFSRVVFCVNLSCVVNNMWIENIEKYGFDYVLGAGLMDLNALIRMRRIFDSFEYMTSNGIGSHVVYAGLCGVKVSLSGPLDYFHPELFRNEPEWKDPQRRQRIAFAHANLQHDVLRAKWPWLYVAPEQAEPCVPWARQETGYDNRVSFRALAEIFNWPVEQLLAEESLLDCIRRLDTANDIDGLLRHLQQATDPVTERIAATVQLLAESRLRAAYILAVLLRNQGVEHVAIAFALALGGLLFNQPEQVARGMQSLPGLLAALPAEPLATFRSHIALPQLLTWLQTVVDQQNGTLAGPLVKLALLVDPPLQQRLSATPPGASLAQAARIGQLWQGKSG